eukprot:TRINITY_DN773094_c0_g1_i1.p1 TRINITY_DN773094_c0_g1~~TRINITY_DN773094_c0_g1_i1.p1  ORF type:complete len:375 (+),score=80.12 TRINITY_DN773094_c0_g1_i1:90-1127(+)
MKLIFAILLLFAAVLVHTSAGFVTIHAHYPFSGHTNAPVTHLSIGEPKQEFKFALSLTNNDFGDLTLLPTNGCDGCKQQGSLVFNETASTTCKETQRFRRVACGGEGVLEGYYDSDTIQIGANVAKGFEFMAVKNVNNCQRFMDREFDGHLAFYPSVKADRQQVLAMRLFDSKMISTPYMSPSYKNGDLDLRFGYPNPSGNRWIPSESGHSTAWGTQNGKGVSFSSAKFEGTTFAFSFDMKAVTGPRSAMNTIYRMIGADNSSNGYPTVDCAYVDSLPTLKLNFGVDEVSLSPKSYIQKNAFGGDSCLVMMLPGHENASWDIGVLAFIENTIIFDYMNLVIGFEK